MIINKEKRYLCRKEKNNDLIKLRDYQEKTVEVIKRMDNSKKFSTLVTLPTGAGKTIIGIRFVLEVLGKGAKVLWLSDRIALLEQTVKTFAKYQAEQSYSRQFICSKNSGNKNIPNDSNEVDGCEQNKVAITYEMIEKIESQTDVIFASVLTIAGVCRRECSAFREWLNVSQKDGKKLYIIYDEAHHIGANSVNDFFTSLLCSTSEYDNVKKFYTVHSFGFIGLTATVYRGDKFLDVFNAWFKDGYKKDIDDLTHINTEYGDYDSNTLSEEELKNNRIELVTIKELINGTDGNIPVLVAPDIIKVSEFENGMPKTVDGEMKYLANRISKHYASWGKTVIIVKTAKMAKMLQSKLEKIKVDSFTYISEDGERNRQKLKVFKESKNKTSIMIAVNMLNEGIDIPDLNTIYLYAPTQSQIVLRQRIGRVLRKADNVVKKEARIIWQYYPLKYQALSKEGLEDLLRKDFDEKKETDLEMGKDINEWEKNKTLSIPAAMYLEELPSDGACKNFFSKLILLEINDLFGEKLIAEAESVGYYIDENAEDSDVRIYVRNVERKGYQQYFRLLQNDLQTVLRYTQKDSSGFEEYAKNLELNEDELIEDIKKICFFLSDTSTDKLGCKSKKRFFVRDKDIKIFYDWFMNGKISYRPIISREKEDDKNYDNEKANMEIPNPVEVIKEEFSYGSDPAKMKRLKLMIRKWDKALIKIKRDKEYTDLLTYAGGKLYQELESLKFLLKEGAVKKKRIKSEKGEIAFIGLTKDFKEAEVKHTQRRCNVQFGENDFWLIASALIDIPNNIYVSKEDVDEYKVELLKNIHNQFEFDAEETQVVKEFLMALGYVENEDIIRMQCGIFKNKIPRILQYILYEKAYKLLADIVEFADGKKNLRSECQNRSILEDEYVLGMKKTSYYKLRKLEAWG